MIKLMPILFLVGCADLHYYQPISERQLQCIERLIFKDISPEKAKAICTEIIKRK